MKINFSFLLLISLFIINKALYAKSSDDVIKTKDSLYVIRYSDSDGLLSLIEKQKFEKVFLCMKDFDRSYEKLLQGKLYIEEIPNSKELIEKLLEKNIEVNLFITLPTFRLYEDMDSGIFENAAKALASIQSKINFNYFLVVEQAGVRPQDFELSIKTYEKMRKYIPVSSFVFSHSWIFSKIEDKINEMTEYLSDEFINKYKKYETFYDILLEVTDYSEIFEEKEKIDFNKVEKICKRHPNHECKRILKIEDTKEDGIYFSIVKYYD